MNKILLEQLSAINNVDVSSLINGAKELVIPKSIKFRYELNKSYIIRLADSFFSLNVVDLMKMWNKATVPASSILKIYVTAIAGKMINIHGLPYNLETGKEEANIWSGWIPVDLATVIKVL